MSSEDKSTVNTIMVVLAVLVVVALGFYIAASMVTSGDDDSGRVNERAQQKIQENIKPVGQVNVGAVAATAAAPAAASGPRSGDAVYTAHCLACHSTGVAGAPKTGDNAAWAPRASKGVDGLLATAISGINAMPPMGTCATCSDDEMKAAIEYMLTESGF